MDLTFDYTDATETENKPSKAPADTDKETRSAMSPQPADESPLTACNSRDYQEMLNVMFRILRNHEKEIDRLNQIITQKSEAFNTLFNNNIQLQSDLQHAQEQKQESEQQLEQARREVQQLKSQLQQLQSAQYSPIVTTAMPSADPIVKQQTLDAIHEEYLRNQQLMSDSMARQASMLPVQARATSASRQYRRKEKPLDWGYYNDMVHSDNKMIELNNDRAKMFFNALHINHIIDEHFRLHNNITNNVACFIETELHRRIPTNVKWEIFDRLFDRKAVRTYNGKTMKPADRKTCKDITDIFDKVELAANQKTTE